MNRRLLITALCMNLLLTVMGAPSLGAESHLSMPSVFRYGQALTPDQTLLATVMLAPEADLNYDTHRVVVSARLYGDVEDYLVPGRPELESYSNLSRPMELGTWGRLDLRDVFVEMRSGRNQFRIGKQQIVWGTLDGIKVLDVLNPQNFREFILEDFAESRIGLWSAYADLPFDHWRAELVLIPDTTAHEIPQAGAWYELMAPRFRFGADPADPLPMQVTDRPEVRDGTIAARVGWSMGPVDLALLAVSGISFEPLGRLVIDTGQPVLELYYERRELFGLQAETAFAGMVFRLEASYQPDRTFNTRSPDELSTVGLDQIQAALGVDLDAPLGVFVNLQYLHDQVMQAPGSLVRPAIDRVVTVVARRPFAYDTLMLELRWFGELATGDGMARASVEYELGPNTRLRLAGDFFYGAPEGLFGEFDGRDRVLISLEHTF